MKLKTAVISGTVALSLVIGGGYGAYYAVSNRKSPVEVVPVSNVKTTYWGDTSSFYGMVTSQMAQTVMLDEEYQVDKVYVQAGDTVKEGDILFTYDMTLPELELEMEQLGLKTQELTLTRLEKDLEKLKKTPATASLEQLDGTMTASAQEEEALVIEEQPQQSESAGTDPDGTGTLTGQDQTAGGAAETEQGQTGDTNAAGGISVEQIETVPFVGDAAGADGEEASLISAALSYQQLVTAVDLLFQSHLTDLQPEDMLMIGNAIEEANEYYRKNLAEEQKKQSQDANGNPVELVEYVLKQDARNALGEEDSKTLEKYADLLEEYHVRYVELLIEQATGLRVDELGASVQTIRAFYGSLSSSRQAEVTGMDQLAAMELELSQNGGTSVPGTGDGQEPQTGESEPQTGESESQTGESELQTGESESQTGESEPQTGESEPQTGESESQTGESEPQTGESESQTGESESQTAQSETQTLDGKTPAAEGELQPYPVFVDNGVDPKMNQTLQRLPGETVELDAADYIPEDYRFEKWEIAAQDGEVQLLTEELTNQKLQFVMPSFDVSVTCHVVREYYPVTIHGQDTVKYKPGDTVTISAAVPEGQEFTQWKVIYPDDPSAVVLADPSAPETTFVMPADSVILEAEISLLSVQTSVEAFESLVETARSLKKSGGAEYLNALGNAVSYYQEFLGQAEEIMNMGDTPVAVMEAYRLRDSIRTYLEGQNELHRVEQLEASYKECAIAYVRNFITSIGPRAFEYTELAEARSILDEAWNLYRTLGNTWCEEMEAQWMQEITDQLASAPQTENGSEGTEEESEGMSDGSEEEDGTPGSQSEDASKGYSLSDLLNAYEVVLMIKGLNPQQQEDLLKAELIKIRDTYMSLPASVKYQVWNSDILMELLKKYGLLDTDENGGGIGDGGMDIGGGMEEGFTASELAEMIKDKEQEIKAAKLSVREAELAVKKKQRIVDGKTVKSTMTGTVISVGESDGTSDQDYFIKVASDAGLYAKGSMNELALETIHVGDTISGVMIESGVRFTAVIKEISKYPDPNGSSMSFSYGAENSNASYYPFYALVEAEEEIEEGDAELQLSETMTTSDDGIYLEPFFVRQESNGQSYVWKQGDRGKLTKQKVVTGKTVYGGSAVEILSGLTEEDRIAFPYSKNVKEGAETKEVDMLKEAYN